MPEWAVLSAGFLLVKQMPRQPFMSDTLIPLVVVSAAECICPRFPGPYAMDWVTMKPEDRDADFEELGVPPALRGRGAAMGEATTPRGFLSAVASGQAIPSGGTSLGYEPLALDCGQFQHSWLCNSLEQHCADVLGVRPGPSGLIDDFADARRCCDEINREEVGAEPGLWLPILLTRYP
jgi:hypothetical protein